MSECANCRRFGDAGPRLRTPVCYIKPWRLGHWCVPRAASLNYLNTLLICFGLERGTHSSSDWKPGKSTATLDSEPRPTAPESCFSLHPGLSGPLSPVSQQWETQGYGVPDPGKDRGPGGRTATEISSL